MTETISSRVTEFPKSRSPRARRRESPVRRHLDECRRIALKQLCRGVPKMLDLVDDSLFQLAEKADHDNTQKLYFDAMREVRIKRPGIEKNFKEYLYEGFEALERGGAGLQSTPESLDLHALQLTLVDDDVLEESLAVTNMANRLAGLCKEDLFALDMRIGWLLEDTAMETHDNPLSPGAICESFARACGEIEGPTEIRLIVLKLFDKHMAATVVGLYQALNQYLVSHDILPYIRAEVRKQPGAAALQAHGLETAGTEQASSGSGGAAAGTSPAAGLTTAGVPPAAGLSSAGVPPAAEYSTAGAPSAAGFPAPGAAMTAPLSQELLQTLQQVMRVNGPAEEAGGTSALAPPQPQLLGQLTALQLDPAHGTASPGTCGNAPGGGILRELRHTDLAESLNHGDELMIDVVAMMFDYVFDDANIPAPMKALIGRLQIPLLKVAMIDKSFFSRRFHPARKLLNSLAEAAVGWREDQDGREGLYVTMERCVQRVLDEFEDQIGVIAEILSEFEASLEEDNRLAEENAWWSAKVVQGRERLASARARVDELLGAKTNDIGYQFISSFILEHWHNLMLTAYVKDGEDSDTWRESLATLDELIWSVTPLEDESQRTRLSKSLPELLANLKQGLARINLPREEAEPLLAKLARIHLAQVRAQSLPDEAQLEALQGEVLPPVAGPASAQDSADATENKPQTEALQHLDVQQLRKALEAANRRIYDQAQARPECSGMGTTMVAAWFREDRLIAAHAGDSRLYRLRDERLEQITLDHSLRQQMVSNGFYTMEEAKEAIASNLVTRALGVDEDVEIEVHEHGVQSGDVYLLCSDGLSDLVADEDIEAVLRNPEMELETAAGALIERANDNGGNDNISVSLVRVWQSADSGNEDSDFLELSSRTDVGRRRAHNEDAQGDRIDAGLVLLADGMGGYNAGEVASRLAVDTVIESLDAVLDPPAATAAPESAGANSDINFTALNALFDSAGLNASGISTEFPQLEPDDVEVWPLEESDSGDCEEIILESDDETVDVDEDGHTRQVAALEIGSWVEFRNDSDSAIRARLTWISESTGNYLFTDRHGHKVVDSTPAGLALQFRRGSAALIEDVPLFERAVNHLLARLRPEAG